MKRTFYIYACLLFLLSSCSALLKAPVTTQSSTLGEVTPYTKMLTTLPLPKEKVVVAVYKFKDQTGQYKPSDNVSNWSTAIPQGTTSILLKALEDSQWFTTIERENISDLLNERQIIKSTRQEYASNDPNAVIQQLPPLLFAGVILEGGIVSYDSNIMTGGVGARYFGMGGASQYRQDRVSVYLRAVSTNNGRIIKTVYTSKTILSQSLTGNLFRYVDVDRLLEADVGVTKNEPVHLAVKEAIEKSVYALIIEGFKDGLWEAGDTEQDKFKDVLDTYDEESRLNQDFRVDNRLLEPKRGSFAFSTLATLNKIRGDYTQAETKLGPKAELKYFFNPSVGLGLTGSVFSIENKGFVKRKFASFDLNLEYLLMSRDNISPFIYVGAGFASPTNNFMDQTHIKLNTGVGMEYLPTPSLGIRAFGAYDFGMDDNWDLLRSGKQNDHLFSFGVGLSFYFGKKHY